MDDQGKVEGCELCEAARFTPWYHEDDICWVAECEACSMPMVVWNRHGTAPPDDQVEHMLACLNRAATNVLGPDRYSVDRVMRQIPDHFHAHARIWRTWPGVSRWSEG